MPVAPFNVKAVYEYKSEEPDDLKFPNGQIITVTEEEDDDWYSGQYVDASGNRQEGIFPKNFVKKYEPEVPSRPSRATKTKRDVDPAPALAAEKPEGGPDLELAKEHAPQVPEAEIEPELSQKEPTQDQSISESSVPTQSTRRSASSVAPPQSPPAAKKPNIGKPAPPQVAEKPNVGSFRDRIAAFNKPAAPPVAPFKPGGQGTSGSSGFIKKPFVAPPPSKNAYVPPPRDPPPQKLYRREEDPEMADEQTEYITAPAVYPEAEDEAGEEAQPKPTSLKERIALLQKQQLEQAARKGEGASKKEKPKKPAKKYAESEEHGDTLEEFSRPSIDRVNTGDTVGKKSVDFADDESGPLRGHSNRNASSLNAPPTPPQPSRELVSDTNDADDSGAGDTDQGLMTEEERPSSSHASKTMQLPMRPAEPTEEMTAAKGDEHLEEVDENGEENEEEDEEEEEEEEEVDPEVKRRMEIRERMAKMSGGMGMMGMFGPAGGMPQAGSTRKPRVSGDGSRNVSSSQEHEDNAPRAPPVPVMALPGMTRAKSPDSDQDAESDEEAKTSRATPRNAIAPVTPQEEAEPRMPPMRTSTDRAAPPVPQERNVPPPPRDVRGAPPPPQRQPTTPASPSAHRLDRPMSPGESSDDERSRPTTSDAPVPPRRDTLARQPTAPPVPPTRPGNASIDTDLPSSQVGQDKRASRGPPPLPPSSPTVASPQTRAPPPPPPGQPPSRRSTSDSHHISSTKHQVDNDSEEEVTEYDGDYDTDIASSAKHKDALKSHGRDSSLDETTLTDDAPSKPAQSASSSRAVPPLPPTNASRNVPPPLPQQNAPKSRESMDVPRAAPPPVPPPKEALDDDYDPYRYPVPSAGVASPPAMRPAPPLAMQSPREELAEDDFYDATPMQTRTVPVPPPAERSIPQTPIERSVPPPPPPSAAPPSSQPPPRPSSDINRTKSQSARRSTDPQSRPSTEQGFIASDIDLAQSSFWWTQDNMPPPALQNRTDILFEIEASTSAKRGGKTTVSKDVYVLYGDYSQSTITANYDALEPHNVTFEQRHERPPQPTRQDILEQASTQYGARISEAAQLKQNSTFGDGSPQAFVLELIRGLAPSGVLLPVGTRSFGATVYTNLANASTQQFDEIRPGDVVTFRNAKFAGHKGTMHAKYALEAANHVAVVLDWDGTKKKIRAWEQGREAAGKKGSKAKVGEESYRMGDLKSGEVRVMRVMGRNWVGWDSGNK